MRIFIELTLKLLGALATLQSLSRVVSPTVLGLLYSYTVGSFPQAVFYVLFTTLSCGFLVSWLVRPNGMLWRRKFMLIVSIVHFEDGDLEGEDDDEEH